MRGCTYRSKENATSCEGRENQDSSALRNLHRNRKCWNLCYKWDCSLNMSNSTPEPCFLGGGAGLTSDFQLTAEHKPQLWPAALRPFDISVTRKQGRWDAPTQFCLQRITLRGQAVLQSDPWQGLPLSQCLQCTLLGQFAVMGLELVRLQPQAKTFITESSCDLKWQLKYQFPGQLHLYIKHSPSSLMCPPCKPAELQAWKGSPYGEHWEAVFSTLCWKLEKQLVKQTWTSCGFIYILSLTTSPCWPLTHTYPIDRAL